MINETVSDLITCTRHVELIRQHKTTWAVNAILKVLSLCIYTVMKCNYRFEADAQFLRDSKMLETAETRANEKVTKSSKVQFYPSIFKVTAKTNQEIPDIAGMGHDDDVGARAMVRAT